MLARVVVCLLLKPQAHQGALITRVWWLCVWLPLGGETEGRCAAQPVLPAVRFQRRGWSRRVSCVADAAHGFLAAHSRIAAGRGVLVASPLLPLDRQVRPLWCGDGLVWGWCFFSRPPARRSVVLSPWGEDGTSAILKLINNTPPCREGWSLTSLKCC